MSNELPISSPYRSTPEVPVSEAERDQLSRRLNAAYTDGQLAEDDYRERLNGCSPPGSWVSSSRWSTGCRRWSPTTTRRSWPAPGASRVSWPSRASASGMALLAVGRYRPRPSWLIAILLVILSRAWRKV